MRYLSSNMSTYDPNIAHPYEEYLSARISTAMALGRAAIRVTPQERRALAGVKFNFIFCTHTIEHSQEIAQALEPYDLMAIEALGNTPESSRRSEMVADAALSRDIPQEGRQRLEALLQKFMEESNDLDWGLLKAFLGSGKSMRHIDMSANHPYFPWVEAEDELEKQYKERLAEGAPNDELLNKLERWQRPCGLNDIAREHVTVRQLLDLGLKERFGPEGMGIVVGGLHTGVRHILDSLGFLTSAQFVAMGPKSKMEKVRYEYEEQLTRTYRFGRSKAPLELLNRTLLSNILYYYNEKGSPLDDSELWAYQVEDIIIKPMSGGEVVALLNSIESIKKSFNYSGDKTIIPIRTLLDSTLQACGAPSLLSRK